MSLYNSKCYLISNNDLKTWTDAKDYCESFNNGTLFLPRSANDEQFFWDYFEETSQTSPTYSINVAALDASNPLNYTQSNGQELDYTNWMPGRPSNGYENGKAWIGIRNGNRGWGDFTAANQNRTWNFICESKLNWLKMVLCLTVCTKNYGISFVEGQKTKFHPRLLIP